MLTFLKMDFLLFVLFLTLTCQTYANDKENPTKRSEIDKEEHHWIDKLHLKINNSVFHSAQWFDSFFTSEDEFSKTSPKTKAKIRLAWLPQNSKLNEFSTKFRIKVRLPNLKNRVSLVFSDEVDDERFQTPLSTNNVLDDNTEYSLAFNYTQKQKDDQTLDHRLGFSNKTIFARSRYKTFIAFSKNHIFLIEPEIYYFLNNNLEARLRFDYNYQLSNELIFRADHNLIKSLTNNQLKWQQGINILNRIDEKSASIWRIQYENEYYRVENDMLENYTFSYKHRFNAFRDWLFFEIEPFLELAEKNNYGENYGIAFRIEGNFIK